MSEIVLDDVTKTHVEEFTESFVNLVSGNVTVFTIMLFLFELCQLVETFTDIHGVQKKNLILYVIDLFAKQKGLEVDLISIGHMIDMIIKVDVGEFIIKTKQSCQNCCKKCKICGLC